MKPFHFAGMALHLEMLKILQNQSNTELKFTKEATHMLKISFIILTDCDFVILDS